MNHGGVDRIWIFKQDRRDVRIKGQVYITKFKSKISTNHGQKEFF